MCKISSIRPYVSETDAPYLAPVPYRGKRNEPGYTRYVVGNDCQRTRPYLGRSGGPNNTKCHQAIPYGRKRLVMNPVIVVEGRDDTRRLREIYPDIETIETNGSADWRRNNCAHSKAPANAWSDCVYGPWLSWNSYSATSFKNAYQAWNMPLSNAKKPSERQS